LQGPLPRTASACAAMLLGPTPTRNVQELPARPSAPQAQPRIASAAPRVAPYPASRLPPRPTPAQPDALRLGACMQEQDSPLDPVAGSASSVREQEAAIEVKRIGNLRRESYGSVSSWGFAVLGSLRDVAAVQRGYRGLMKKLHPDKVQHSASVSKALEALKDAKEACERYLSRQVPPGVPRKLSFTPLCTTPGRRRYRLYWTAPQDQESAPIRRYIVAALDPAYGKALNIATLEPDYSEELKRFVSVEELGAFVLAEEELQKMPKLWCQNAATIQVAAANEAGQSAWAILQVPLGSSGAHAAGYLPFNSLPPMRQAASGTPGASPREDVFSVEDFAVELKRHFERSGEDLRIWLERCRKPQIVAFLQTMGWPDEGTKGILIDRVIKLMERQRPRNRPYV